MLRSKLHDKRFTENSNQARLLYKKQRNVCVFLLKNAKKGFELLAQRGSGKQQSQCWETKSKHVIISL